jgi:DNA-binding MarR family transcriptional regulator
MFKKLAQAPKYVNMADVKMDHTADATLTDDAALRVLRAGAQNEALVAASPEAAPMFDLIELLFFAYRDFVGDADRLLEAYGFGRAHHRVLHFVNRRPNLMIAELLDILRITKQSLNRVLKDLLEQGFVEARPGIADRRQRLLVATAKGRRLALDLAGLQTQRFARALSELPADARGHAMAFLLAMVDPQERGKIAEFAQIEAEPMQPPLAIP